MGEVAEGVETVPEAKRVPPEEVTARVWVPGRELPIACIREIHSRILAEVPGVARVALDISPKPPATTEWE